MDKHTPPTFAAPSSIILQNVLALVDKKLPKTKAKLVKPFVLGLFSHISEDDLTQRNDNDMYGVAISLWNALNRAQPSQDHVKVYNPSLSRHGWQSSHSIIEIIVKDMPFLVDSVQMALQRQGIIAHLLLHQPMAITRSQKGNVTQVASASEQSDKASLETVFLIEIDRQSEEQQLDTLAKELNSVMHDVTLVVQGWQPMQQQLKQVVAELNEIKPEPGSQIEEVSQFLTWLANHNLTLMGYRHYQLKAVKGDHHLIADMDTSLGLFQQPLQSQTLSLADLPAPARQQIHSDKRLVLTKTEVKSRVHRPAYIDHIGIKQFNKQGKVIGEHRFIGLYASSLYNTSASQIPLVSAKVGRIMEQSALIKGSHAYKALLNVLETYPRDELLQASESELLHTGTGVLQMQERDMIRLFIRRDTFGRYISCLVYVTKDRYNTALRVMTQDILARYFNSQEPVEFNTYFTEGVLARTEYLVRVRDFNQPIDIKEIENNLIEAARSWEDKLQMALFANFGEAKGNALVKRYANGFPRAYKEDVLAGSAVADIEALECLNEKQSLQMLFYRAQEELSDSNKVKLKLFHINEPIHLSDVLPKLENMGLKIIGERPYSVNMADGKIGWILEFLMTYEALESTSASKLNIDARQQDFQQAFAAVWFNQLEDDGFNRLVLGAGLTGRQIVIIRAYAKYMRQTGTSFSQQYIEQAFNRYPDIAAALVHLFATKFSPSDAKTPANESDLAALTTRITAALDDVVNLDDDRIFRHFLEMMNATVRTNFYQLTAAGEPKAYVSLKVRPSLITDMPKPLPAFEIFVYSPEVEGVHLRGGKVARGGLRWSDRREDFRTEVLGLVKAQQVKNTVIVPVGAKGGFVCKQPVSSQDRGAWLAQGQECYRTFIRALLDVTDNIVEGEVSSPTQVVRYDDDDPYLVVAADKGTATFSDIANEISEQYHFWLADAFASGGSQGYDHKKMGITAKGAWESVKRHFKEMGINCQQTDFTCVGIGDMAGDVFGNGMLLSKHIRLQGAFNHLHIFIDPAPDAASSWTERDRLFKLPGSSWQDYDTSLISPGGGIFSRSAKSIALSPQMQAMLATDMTAMAPNQLIKALLTMPVDLLWNGGIGTYVKARSESDSQVGDRANDGVRIDGEQLQAKVVGEGGNLGCTQLGRIEFAMQGGRIDTDFIDNVGGVDCSDNEVNIKILLNGIVAQGELTTKQRNALLVKMTDNVTDIVLTNAYRQAQSLSVTQADASGQLKEHIRFMQGLEKQQKLDRALEYLPADDELADRLSTGQGLTRPELSVLLAYGKMVLKELFVTPDISDDAYFIEQVRQVFPLPLQQHYQTDIQSHPLRAELIATQLANQLVNDVGFNFVARMTDETGAAPAEIGMCYTIARQVFDIPMLTEKIEALDNKVDAKVQLRMMQDMRRTLRRATRWFLRLRNRGLTLAQNIALYQPAYQALNSQLDKVLNSDDVAVIKHRSKAYQDQGVPATLATAIAQQSFIFSVLDLAQIAEQQETDLLLAANVYFNLGAKLELHWFLDQINLLAVDNHWQALARASFREELDWHQRTLAITVLSTCDKAGFCNNIIDPWLESHEALLERWYHMLADFKTSSNHEFAKFSVALRELNLLNLNCMAEVEQS
ncbi:NAD-glutamate dehydrogenase [Motilimonas pumila]|uniref:NAD-glutamate dehydrogenase n=1 Tax=Motilimonas pumila TaxID=2303987 RepID=A0A418YBQ1_9GAMM|nr:NAD-glutamate dehydrogenase [Motilimonas pumila]RJG41856.1 NAD-glutamate dehydrogenase [Motilimonas pumila]